MPLKAFLDTDKTLDKLALPTANLRSYREQIKHTLTGSQHARTSSSVTTRADMLI
jgi:hypothetical protein